MKFINGISPPHIVYRYVCINTLPSYKIDTHVLNDVNRVVWICVPSWKHCENWKSVALPQQYYHNRKRCGVQPNVNAWPWINQKNECVNAIDRLNRWSMNGVHLSIEWWTNLQIEHSMFLIKSNQSINTYIHTVCIHYSDIKSQLVSP